MLEDFKTKVRDIGDRVFHISRVGNEDKSKFAVIESKIEGLVKEKTIGGEIITTGYILRKGYLTYSDTYDNFDEAHIELEKVKKKQAAKKPDNEAEFFEGDLGDMPPGLLAALMLSALKGDISARCGIGRMRKPKKED